MGYNWAKNGNMKKRELFLSYTLALLCCSAMISSCGSYSGVGGGGWLAGQQAMADANHQLNIVLIEKNYKDCLASAQNAADSANCETKHDEELEKEKGRYDNELSTLNEKKKCAEYLLWVMDIWDYSKKESNKVVAELLQRKGNDYSFDATEAIAELIKDGKLDNLAVKVFERELPKFGLSKGDAVNATKQYYEDELYTKMNYNDKNTIEEPYWYKFGNSIQVTEGLLKHMGLIDNDNDDDDDDDDDDDMENMNDNGTTSNNSTLSLNDSQTKPTPSPYQVESNEIANYSVSHYKLDVGKLTSEQRSELDKVIAFMKKWPDAKITIVGHTCSIGGDEVNNRIGLYRAHQAKLYMVSQGVDENRIGEVSKAAFEPVTGNDTEKGRLQNRRITFIVK